MLLTISTTHQPATDLGYLLFKHPDRFQAFNLACGNAQVFYPEASDTKCTAALVLDINPVDLARGKAGAKTQTLVLDGLNRVTILWGVGCWVLEIVSELRTLQH